MTLRDCSDPATWWPHVDEATRTLAAGGLVVLPTDTVYGIAADAFKPEAVQALLDAKGRGRQMPPPVLIGDVRTLDGLADEVPDTVRELVAKHWPGPLTIILRAQPSLQWDLGETRGTVALRMPDHELALAVLRRTGPLAVSSANTTGSPAATTARAASDMLGTSVRVYLDGGTSPGGAASTIVDATGPTRRIVREGALNADDLGIAVDEPPAPEAAASTTGKVAIADADDVVIAPRRVRRTPDPAPATDSDQEPAPEESETPTPRRTRKPAAKPAAPAGENTDEAVAPTATEAPKPRRTRTRAATPTTAAGEGAEEAVAPAATEAPKPRRTRKPAAKPTTTADESGDEAAAPEAPAP